MSKALWMLCCMVCVICGGVSVASAHGGNPLPRSIDVLGDGEWLLLTNFGVMTSKEPTHYVCEELFLGAMDFEVVPVDLDTWVTFSRDQISVTRDAGCSFEKKLERTSLPTAVAMSPERARAAWLSNEQDGASTLEWTEDLVETTTRIDLAELGLIQWTSLHFSDERVLYFAGYSQSLETRGQARVFSVDLETEEIVDYEGWESVTYPYIFDVYDDEIAGLASVSGELSLLWDSPGDAVSNKIVLDSWPVDMGLSADGQRLAVAGAVPSGASLVFWRDEDEEVSRFEFFADDPTSCAAWMGEDVIFCAKSSAQDFSLAAALPEVGATRRTLVNFQDLEGPRDTCGESSDLAKTCSLVWPELARALRIELPGQDLDMGSVSGDMGPGDMGFAEPDMIVLEDMAEEEMSAMEPPSPHDDGGICSHVGLSQRGDYFPIALILFGFCALSWRRKCKV